MHRLISSLQQDFPKLSFSKGSAFCWSPLTQEIIYQDKARFTPLDSWSLLHEVAHALLNHQSYQSDFELLLMESEAWHRARELASKYHIKIDTGHVQDCLDTYRDWLYRRSSCPTCGNQSLQANSKLYQCFNCDSAWKVSLARFCRPYRLRIRDTLVISKRPA